jgi:membrane-bound lytic murein transglycosylase D
MRKALFLISFLVGLGASAFNPTPSVPSTITIANLKLKISSEAQREIQKDIDALRASDKYFQVKIDRINLYFPLVEKALREEGVPDDLKYLAVQESALISDAVSSADAVGYWQFKDFTAREVGLRVDNQIDERKNIVASSHGAAKYLKKNNFYVKNWMYAVNAYMTGVGGVKKYVDEKDFGADHMEITEKTHWYVKRFIAHVIAFKDEVGAPHSEGLSLTGYDKGSNKTLDQIAKEFKIDEPLLSDYNKWLKSARVPDDKTYWVIVPIKGKVPAQLANQNSQPAQSGKKIDEPKSSSKTHSSKTANDKNVLTKKNDLRVIMATSTDDIASLAQKSHLLTRQIVQYNDLIYGEKVQRGELYYIQSKRNSAKVPYHVVKYGETMWEISQNYGIKLKKLQKKNRMKSPDKVEAGRVLWMKKKRPFSTPIEYKKVSEPAKPAPIPEKKVEKKVEPPKVVVKKEPEVAPVKKETPIPKEEEKPRKHTKVHVVQSGESLWLIAKKYSVSVEELLDWNGLAKDATLQPGQELQLTPGKAEEKIEEPKKEEPKKALGKTYTVKKGDTMYGIARSFGMTLDELKALNNKSSNELAVGEELKVK